MRTMENEYRKISVVKEWERDGLKYHVAYVEWSEFLRNIGRMHDHYSGYVTFPECPIAEDGYDNEAIRSIDVHGGITYAVEEDDGSYTYGFDCAHLYDEFDTDTQDLDWLTAECESMGRQIIELAARESDGE